MRDLIYYNPFEDQLEIYKVTVFNPSSFISHQLEAYILFGLEFIDYLD